MIHLGSKYQVPQIVEAGVNELSKRLPSELSLWYQRKDFCQGQPADVIAMASTARSLGLRDLHLRALYECCQLPPDVLVTGLYPQPFDKYGTMISPCTALGHEDLKAIIDGRESLRQHGLSMVFDSLSHFPTEDPADVCSQKKEKLFASMFKLSVRTPLGPKCIAALSGIITCVCKEEGICEACTEECVKKYEEQSDDLLKNLGRVFKIQVSA